MLILLCAQNSLYTLLRRYSRGVLGEKVSSSAVLLAAEALKFAVAAVLVERPDCLAVLPSMQQMGVSNTWPRERLAVVWYTLKHGRPMAAPAITYLIMNMLSFKALELVDATVFAMIAQLKILTTAVFCRLVLGRKLSMPQWRAIFVLTLAVAIITYQRGAGRVACRGPGPATSRAMENVHLFVLGVLMVLMEISLSGWISAYFEKYLKDGSFTVWGRNLQLACWSMAIYSVIGIVQSFILVKEASTEPTYRPTAASHSVLTTPLVGGWSIITLMLVALGGGGGLLVAFAIKFADAVVKSMATAFALVVVAAAEIALFGEPADPIVCLAGGIALLGLQYYGDAPKYDQDQTATAEEAPGTGDVQAAEVSENAPMVSEIGCSARETHIDLALPGHPTRMGT